jgi:hypothetical protein
MATEWVRISDMADRDDLTVDQVIDGMVMLIHELATAQALKMVHGEERASVMYAERGGIVRFDEQGEACVPLDVLQRERKHND